jgi:hypothetical protein
VVTKPNVLAARHHDVGAAEFLLHRFRHGRDRVGARHIADHRESVTSRRFDELHGLAPVRHIGDGNVHAVFGETLCKSLPNPIGAAGDDGDFILMAFSHA